MTALVGLVNVASALTPDIRWRGELVLAFEPLRTVQVFHAVALPMGAALLLVAPYLLKRRRRALYCAMYLMLALGFVNLLKGLDFEECVLGWAVACGLWAGRGSFTVEHEPITLHSAIWRVPALGIAGITLVFFADWVAHGHERVDNMLDESGALLRWRHGSGHGVDGRFVGAIDHHVHWIWIPLAVHFIEIATLLGIAYVVFRPLSRPNGLPSAAVRRLAVQLVRQHGSDTLAFFKLRSDKQLFFNDDRTAFVGYRIEAGMLLVSGDPVGPPVKFPELLASLQRFAGQRGLKLGALGASEALLPTYRQLGLHAIYLGDEAIVQTAEFSLEGRAIRKVRQSVSRLHKAGYSAELHTLATISEPDMSAIERVQELGRLGRGERGFAMGMDGIHGALEEDTLFVLARDRDGEVRGMLHFVPCYGRPAVSLSMMRRDPATPNGLMEFLVVSAIEQLRERGVGEVSLNFAAFSRFIRDPQSFGERALAWVCTTLFPSFQVESLYRFNVKFLPRWDARYIVYEGKLGFPRAALASMWAEGQIPKPSVQSVQARVGQRTLTPVNR